eukprot:CAMPEP_0180094394 /NCGR_PEP_ID=MMETSP0985-20121206/25595_1 /TAXON_ID=483367 /ORGANISM="non described non described, Strain CCMP 2436" /LENGTH=90 /DNA_ID=CAMNT_0022029567 /DNA_START=1856 /DNA_END=2128 /DNA_ORIENTATION=+
MASVSVSDQPSPKSFGSVSSPSPSVTTSPGSSSPESESGGGGGGGGRSPPSRTPSRPPREASRTLSSRAARVVHGSSAPLKPRVRAEVAL